MSRSPSAMRRSLAWTIPAMPSLIVRRYCSSARRTAAGRTARRRLHGVPHAGDDELRVRLHHVVLLLERLLGELPVHREPGTRTTTRRAATRPSRRRGWWRPARCTARSGGASSSRLIHAQPPQVSHCTGTRSMSPGWRLCSREACAAAARAVLRAVLAVAPAVERAGEAALAGAPPLARTLHAAVAAGVLEGPHLAVVGAHDDHRLVEDLVLDEVARRSGSPRAGRPSATPGARAARPPARRTRGRSSAPSATRSGTSIAKGTGSAVHLVIHDRCHR